MDNEIESIEGGGPILIGGIVGIVLILLGLICIIVSFHWGDGWFSKKEQVVDPNNNDNEALPESMETTHWVAIGGLSASALGGVVLGVSGMALGGGSAVRAMGRAGKSQAGYYIGLIIVAIIGIIIALAASYYDKWYFNAGKDKKVTFAHIFGPASSKAQSIAMWTGIGLAILSGVLVIGRLAFKGGKKGMKSYAKYKKHEETERLLDETMKRFY